MSQTSQVVEILKVILRERRITYADVATHLDLSEANVKRMFAKRHFTIARLEQICILAQTDFAYLFSRMDEDAEMVEELTLASESELANNIKLLMMAQLLMNRWKVEDITAAYTYDELEVIQLLAKLDRMGIVELLPGNRVRNRLSRNFKWRHNGPVYKFFESQVLSEFFDCKFNPKSGELLIFMAGMLTRKSNEHIQNSMRRLAKEFDEICKEDEKLPVNETFGSGLVIALRPWELGAFAQFRRTPNTKKF